MLGRHEAHDPAVTRIDHQPAILALAVDRRDRVEQSAQPRRAQRGKPVMAKNCIDLGGRQQRTIILRAISLRTVALWTIALLTVALRTIGRRRAVTGRTIDDARRR